MNYIYKLSTLVLLISNTITANTVNTSDFSQDPNNKETSSLIEVTTSNEPKSSTELLSNGDFELELTNGWSGLKNFSHSNDVAENSNGSKSLKIETSEQVNLIYTKKSSFFSLEVGQTYLFKGKIKAEKMDFNALIFRLMPSDVQWHDKEKFVITSPNVKWGTPRVKIGEWVSFEKEIVIQDNFGKGNKKGDIVSSKLFIQGSKNTSEAIILLDDLSISKVGGEETSTAPTSTIDAKPEATELVKNGNFEGELNDGWYGLKNFTKSSDVATDKNEGKSLKIVTSEQIKVISTKKDAFFPLEVGKSYKLKGRVKAEAMNFNTIIIRLMPGDAQWHDREKMTISAPKVKWGDVNVKQGEWITFEKVIKIEDGFGKGNKKGDVVPSKILMQTSPVKEESIFFLDEISITEVTESAE